MTSADDRSLRFTCPQCLALLKTASAPAGTRLRCPRCQFVFQAPHEASVPRRRDVYPLHETGGPSLADQAMYIPVTCTLCHTRMYATPEQVGQTLVCPDCGRSTVVPPPAAPAKIAAPPLVAEGYALQQEVPSSPSGDRVAEAGLIRVMCPRCQTMLYGTEHQVGGKIACPDCGMLVVVPPAPPTRRPINVMAGAGEGYRLAGEDATKVAPTTPTTPRPPPVAAAPRAAPERVVREFQPYLHHAILPRRPFLSGTFAFPFSGSALFRVLLLAAWAMMACGLAAPAIQLGSFEGGLEVAPLAAGSASLMVVAVIIGLMWFAFAAACALAIVRDTASGCDRIQNWPEMSFIDWLFEPLYVFNSVGISLLPGAGLAWLLVQYGKPSEVAMPVSVFLVFPFVLLSMLETNSPLGAISWPVCQTLWRAPLGWIAFYLTSAILLGAAVTVMIGAVSASQLWVILVAVLPLTAIGLIYFRLLGRLAWYCTDRIRRAAEAEAEADEDEDQDGSAVQHGRNEPS
jgi:DNA-directed RNA polymerase subunit M/transcription elongation factor TFIIS